MRLTLGHLRCILREVSRTETRGWWIDPDGNLTEVPDGTEHAEGAPDILGIDISGMDEDEAAREMEAARSMLLSQGWIIIRYWSGRYTVTLRQLSASNYRYIRDAFAAVAGSTPGATVFIDGCGTLTVNDLLASRTLRDAQLIART